MTLRDIVVLIAIFLAITANLFFQDSLTADALVSEHHRTELQTELRAR